MEVLRFRELLRDRHFPDYTALHYKYGDLLPEFLRDLYAFYGVELPLQTAGGDPLWLLEGLADPPQDAVKNLLRAQTDAYGKHACAEEMIASSAIEDIDLQREIVRNILRGLAPANDEEQRVYGQKLGYDFITDPANEITEENIHRLYMLTVGAFLPPDTALPEGCLYRNDEVFVVSSRVEHSVEPPAKVPEMMRALTDFINTEDRRNDLVKAAVIHCQFALIHPYFDGNGRMARMLHLWYLLRRGYRSALFLPFSYQIRRTRRAYYNTFTLIRANAAFSGKTDVTPFVTYFIEHVYRGMADAAAGFALDEDYTLRALPSGRITPKENDLWTFVRSAYGAEAFSTKQLEKDYGKAAYATIYKFVQKFTELGYLRQLRYGARVRYQIRADVGTKGK